MQYFNILENKYIFLLRVRLEGGYHSYVCMCIQTKNTRVSPAHHKVQRYSLQHI